MSDDEKIVSLADVRPHLQTKRLSYTDKKMRCDHMHVVVSASEPILECNDCGAIVDPFGYIRSLSGIWDRLMAQKKSLENEIELLKASKAQVRRELRQERDAAEREARSGAMVLPPHMTGKMR